MRKIWIITLFPEFFNSLKNLGVVGKAFGDADKKKVQIELLQLRDFSLKNYKGVDDSPYGGGAGMVMRADILKNALEKIIELGSYENLDQLNVIYTSPRGKIWNDSKARELSENQDKDLVFICGRYEGIDERFIQKYVNEIYSLGDFVLSGGELAVATMIDSFMRFIPGVLGNSESFKDDSFSDGLLEGPQYTRPSLFEGEEIPKVLLSGNHQKISEYRLTEKIKMTKKHRMDLFEKYMKDKDLES